MELLKWTCMEPGCSVSGTATGEWDWLENDATAHSATHARGMFDQVGEILIEELTSSRTQ